MEDDNIIPLKNHLGVHDGSRDAQTCPEDEQHFVHPGNNIKRRRFTKAELHYRMQTLFALIVGAIFLALALFSVLGIAAICTIKEISIEPRKSYIIYDTAKKLKRTSGIKNKIDVIYDGIEKFNGDVELYLSESPDHKSYLNTLVKLSRRLKSGKAVDYDAMVEKRNKQ